MHKRTWLNRPSVTQLPLLLTCRSLTPQPHWPYSVPPKMSYSCKILDMDFPLPGMLSIKVSPDLLVFVFQTSALVSFLKKKKKKLSLSLIATEYSYSHLSRTIQCSFIKFMTVVILIYCYWTQVKKFYQRSCRP